MWFIGCHAPGPVVQSVEWVGIVEQSEAIQGRDGGPSAQVWGQSVWTFGDTVLNVLDEDGSNWHHNSYSITQDMNASDGISGFSEPVDAVGAPDYLIAPTEEEYAFNMAHLGEDCAEAPCGARYAVWPGAPVWDEVGQRAMLFFEIIYAEPGDMNFEGRGSSVAVWESLERAPARVDTLWGESELGYGVGSVVMDGYLYSFSCDSDQLDCPCSLGRVPTDQVANLGSWEYRTRNGWSPDPKEARGVVDAASIFSVSFDAYLDSYLMVYSPPFDDDIVARTAFDPWGPWSAPSVLYTATDEDPYDALHHAEYQEESGRVQYLTWSRPNEQGWFGTEFPLLKVAFE